MLMTNHGMLICNTPSQAQAQSPPSNQDPVFGVLTFLVQSMSMSLETNPHPGVSHILKKME
jgi:hypothetical protein